MPYTETTSDEAAPRAHPLLRGYVETVNWEQISGWAFDPAAPETRVAIVISANGQAVGRVLADGYRPDLEGAGMGDGHHGFRFAPSDILATGWRHTIEVVSETDGRPLPGSPMVLEPKGASASMVRDSGATTLGTLRGNIEGLTRSRLEGWAADDADPFRHVGLVVSIDDRIVTRALANHFRQDLRDAGLGDGRHGFHIAYPELSPLIAHEVHVRRETDGMELPGSPIVVPATAQFDNDLEQGLANILAAIETEADEKRALDFLTEQLDRLLARHADRESSRSARLAQSMFRRRWGKLPDAAAKAGLAEPSPARRALVIDDHVPRAGRDAGSVAILSHMRALIALGYEVSFVASRAIDDKAAMDALARDMERIAVCGGPFYHSVEDVLKRQASCFDVVYLHRISNARDYLSLVRTHQPKARIVYSVADLHHIRLARQGEVERRPELAALSRQVAFGEFLAANQADAVITHSPFEAELLREKTPPHKVFVVPWAIPVEPCATPFGERQGLAVIGQFGHAPNPDAVFWLTRSVMPIVWATDPSIRCLVVGHGWTTKSLRQRDERVEIVGPVPNLHDIFSRVRLSVAPLRFGAGIKGKVLESFAAGIPCVMTPVAAEGLALPPALEDLVAGGEEELAALILRYHANEAASQAAAAAGLVMIAELASEQRVVEAIRKILPPSK